MAIKGGGSVAAAEFEEDSYEALFDIQLNNNAELWLVQLPHDDFPDINGQSLTLDLDEDGELGSVKGPDGTVYSLINFPSDVADTTVFVSNPPQTKVAGKITRHVSLIHYPEPKKQGTVDASSKKRKPMSSKTTFTKSQFSTPTRTTTHKSTSPHNNRRQMIAESGGTPKSGRSRQSGDSGLGYSGVTTASGSSEQSHHKKSKTVAE